MTIFQFHNPVEIHFGPAILNDVPKKIGTRPWLLVTHPDAPLAVWRKRLVTSATAPITVIEEVEPNPSLSMLRIACTAMSQSSRVPELIVALGGGSVMDTAKFLAAGHGHYDSVVRHLENAEPLRRRALPIIAIPTTAGTGSDLTKWATVWDPDLGRKLSLSRDDLYPEAAFIDPLITASLPWSITLASGLDALSHALESLWNVNASPITRAFAVIAAQDVMTGLQQLKTDLSDAEARARLAQGAMKAGLAFSNTQTALAHSISYPLTLNHDVPHGIACAFCLPFVMNAAIGIDPACDSALSTIFGDLVEAPRTLRMFLNALAVPSSPSELGVGRAEWDQIVKEAFAGPRGGNFIGSLSRFPSQWL